MVKIFAALSNFHS